MTIEGIRPNKFTYDVLKRANGELFERQLTTVRLRNSLAPEDPVFEFLPETLAEKSVWCKESGLDLTWLNFFIDQYRKEHAQAKKQGA